MSDNLTASRLLADFETMKTIELDARDFYVRASDDPGVDDEARRRFAEIGADESRHVELVDQVLNIIRNCL